MTNGIARLGGRCHDRGTTHTRFVGEQSAGDTIAGSKHHRTSHETSSGCLGRKGRDADELQRWPNKLAVHEQDDNTADDIEKCHKRYERRTNPGDALDAAQDHEADQYRDDQSRNDGIYLIGLEGECGNGIGLDRITDSEGCNGGKDGKEYGHPFPAEPPLQGIHRTTQQSSVLRLHAVFHGQQPLRIFRGNAEETRQPAPQHSPGASKCHSRSHTDDVTRSDGGGQSRC